MTSQDKQDLTNEHIKEDWGKALAGLMHQVKEWIESSDQTESLKVVEQIVELNEDYMGKYDAPMLLITKGNAYAEVRPIGRFAIGAIGRVDITNYKTTFTFLYSRSKGWLYLENRKPLTSSVFYDLLQKLFYANSFDSEIH